MLKPRKRTLFLRAFSRFPKDNEVSLLDGLAGGDAKRRGGNESLTL